MLLGEGVELLGQHAVRQPERSILRGGLEFAVELEQEALLQVPRADPGGVQLLDDAEHGLELFLLHLDALPKGEIRGDRIQVPAQIAGLVEVADQERGQQALAVGHRTQPDLCREALGKGLPGPERQVPVLVLSVVVDGVAVAGCGIVEVGVEVEIVPGLAPVVIQPIRAVELLLLFPALLEGGVDLQLLLDARLQFQRGHLQQLHQLDLLGAQLLLEFLLEALLEHAGI